MRIAVTGGAGFIGSNFLCHWVPRRPNDRFLNLDALTYAANPQNVAELEGLANYAFERIDIAELAELRPVLESFAPELIVHFAAESHVDRSIENASQFVRTNVLGTVNLLEVCRGLWGAGSNCQGLFHHVSTDEVFGSLGKEGRFTESTPYAPRNPYAASKAASDHFVRAFANTYGVRFKLSNCSNNYGPRQAPEKFIPLTISRALAGKSIPVYGDGSNVRDWLYVEDHCVALWRVIEHGRLGETYNIGGGAELDNDTLARTVCRVLAEETGRDQQELLSLIEYVADRPGHDYRYAMDASKILAECAWRPQHSFESGIRATIRWYLQNPDWLLASQNEAHVAWISRNYGSRQRAGG